ncbi:MAG TPA: hypothetical protein DCO67_06440 [Staphylococcus sp.]|nr:hypothetical protein [Staphylococcus sp.]
MTNHNSISESITLDNSINNLSKDLYELISLAHRLEYNPKNLMELLGEITVLKMISNNNIISVSGLQSTGKTTLIKRALKLPDEVLKADVGVGEKRPVLISENEDKTNEKYIYKKYTLKNVSEIKIHEQEMGINEFNDGVENPGNEDLWFEIVIPKVNSRNLNNLKIALLPGIERDEEASSQKFLKTFINCSTGVLLTVNHDRMAMKNQSELIDYISGKYKDKLPGFIVTYSNTLTDSHKNVLFKNLKDKFNIDTTTQIITTDTDDDQITEKFFQLLHYNSYYTTESEKLSYEQIQNFSYKLSNEILILEETYNKTFDSEIEVEQSNLNRWIKKERARYFKNFKNSIEKTVNTYISGCIKTVNENIRDEENSGALKTMKSYFKKTLTFKEKEELKEWVTSIYKQGDLSGFKNNIIEGIESVNQKVIKNNYRFNEINENRSIIGNNKPSKINEMKYYSEQLNTDLQKFDLYLNSKDSDLQLNSKNIKILPLIAGSFIQKIYEISIQTENEKTSQVNKENFNKITFEDHKLLVDSQNLTKGLVVFFGIDAIDGSLDTVKAMGEVISLIGFSAAKAIPAAMAVIATITAANVIIKGSKKIEKYKFQRAEYAENVLRASGEFQIKQLEDIYNEFMDEIEEKLLEAFDRNNFSVETNELSLKIQTRIKRVKNHIGILKEVSFRNAKNPL